MFSLSMRGVATVEQSREKAASKAMVTLEWTSTMILIQEYNTRGGALTQNRSTVFYTLAMPHGTQKS